MISFECWYNVRYELRKYTERPIYRISRTKQYLPTYYIDLNLFQTTIRMEEKY